VARALAILAEEASTWRARQAATRMFKVTDAQSATGGGPARTVLVRLTVNGTSHMLWSDPRSSLLDVLRKLLALTGAKKGCDHGQCGACTVHLDGRSVLSCLTLAVQADGRQVTTIEGLGLPGGDLHPIQQAFIDHDALQSADLGTRWSAPGVDSVCQPASGTLIPRPRSLTSRPLRQCHPVNRLRTFPPLPNDETPGSETSGWR
jgi:hypothetical protein